MALTAEVSNGTYGYMSGGSVSYNATLTLKEDTEIVGGCGLSATTSFLIEGWKDRLKEATIQQANEYIAQFKFMMQLVQTVYPSAIKPEDAVVALTAEVNSEIIV